MMWQPLLMFMSLVIVIVDSTQPCHTTYSAWGRYLKGHAISTEKVKNIGMCYVECSKDQRCKSINFHFNDLICGLNDAERHTHPWDYVLKDGHAYGDYPVKVPFKEYDMTPSWLETHASIISSFRSTTADQITFTASSLNYEALIKVPLVPAGVLADGSPLTVEITVANDVSIGQDFDSDIKYGVSDGTNFIGFTTVDKGNYRTHSPCNGIEATPGATILVLRKIAHKYPIPRFNSYPDQFVFTLKLDTSWGSCFIAHDRGFIKTVQYSKELVPSQGLTLEVYKGGARERVGIKYIKATVMKTEG